MNKKETVGKVAFDLLNKTPNPVSIIDQTRESLSDYEKGLLECAELGQKAYQKDFFMNVIFKQEPLMENVFRCFFVHRKSCPTPDYDQIVYKYDKSKDIIDFLWVIPSRGTCHHLINNAIAVANEEKELLKNVLDFADGTLFKRCLKLNNEDATALNVAIIRTDDKLSTLEN